MTLIQFIPQGFHTGVGQSCRDRRQGGKGMAWDGLVSESCPWCWPERHVAGERRRWSRGRQLGKLTRRRSTAQNRKEEQLDVVADSSPMRRNSRGRHFKFWLEISNCVYSSW